MCSRATAITQRDTKPKAQNALLLLRQTFPRNMVYFEYSTKLSSQLIGRRQPCNAMHLLVWRCQCIVEHPKTISGQRTHTRRHARSHGMRYAIQRTRETEKKARDQCVVIISIITKPCASALCAFWPDVATQCDAGVRRVRSQADPNIPPCCQPAHVLAMRLFLE